jgi:signal transduction histidine kinase
MAVSRPARAAWVVPATCVALLGGFALLITRQPLPSSANPENLSGLPMSLAFSVVGAVIVSHQPRHRLGLLFLGVGLASALTLFLFSYAYVGLQASPGSMPGALAVGWVSSWIWALTFSPAFTLGVLLFPDGRLPGRRWRWAAALSVTGIGLNILGAAFAPGPLDGFPARQNPLGISGAGPVAHALGNVGFPITVLGMGLAVASQVVRWRAAGPGSVARRQISLVALAAGSVFVLVLLPGPAGAGAAYYVDFSVMLLVPAAIGVAIVRHRLYDIDVTLNRSLVYGGLTAAVLLVYASVVAVAGQVGGSDSPLAAGVAAALAAVVLLPLRGRLQRGVDRLMYGEGGDPYQAASRLADRLSAVGAPGEALDAVVDGVRRALRATAVGVTIDGELVATSGELSAATGREHMPLVHQGVKVGELLVAVPGGRELDQRRRALLTELGRQAAPAVLAARLVDDVQASRAALVSTREEERRRVRRDLHDGLGPTLAGVALGIDVALGKLDVDPDGALAMLKDVKEEANAAVTEVRRIAYALRPPALDELGLDGALRRAADRAGRGRGQLVIEVRAGGLPALDAATEVAAYRIAVEALTNAVRHARASRIEICVEVDGRLVVEVRDDGRGLAESAATGVGIAGMHERAAELGGGLTVESGPTGTTVRAVLPLAAR